MTTTNSVSKRLGLPQNAELTRGEAVALNAGLDAKFAGMSDTAYCLYIEQMRRPSCLGWEAKVRAGQFGRDNLEAFMRAAEMLGRHKALAEAAQMVRAAASNDKVQRPSVSEVALEPPVGQDGG